MQSWPRAAMGLSEDGAEGVLGSSNPPALGIHSPWEPPMSLRGRLVFSSHRNGLRACCSTGTARAIPVGQINARPFPAPVVGIGFDAKAVAHFVGLEALVIWAGQDFLVESCAHSSLIPTACCA